MTDERDEIRARVDIVDLVSRRIALKRSGRRFVGLCPFHDDKNPSFFVDPQSGRYKCWACGESGDIFTWIMKTEHVDFADALKELAEIAGVKVSRGQQRPSASLRDVHRKAMAEARGYFTEQLAGNEQALAYCRGRGLDEDTLKKWEVGFAPSTGDGLAVRLQKAGIALAEGASLFLVERDASGGYFDRFRGRLMFPIRDERGELVAFGGRLLGDGQPKYINSSDTPLYSKSRVLYGMSFARDPMSRTRRAVLVEGYLDVIACHRSGLDTAVASLGTALSELHAKLLKRWVEDVAVLYDSDEAGQKAADRAIDVLEAEDLRASVALMPQGEDPDTLLRTKGPEAVRNSVEARISPVAFRLAALEHRLEPSQEQFWKGVVEILAASHQGLEVEAQVTRLSTLYPGLRDSSSARERLLQMVGRARGEAPRSRSRKQVPRQEAMPEYVPLGEPLAPAEVVLFGAFHVDAFRQAAWMTIVRLTDVFPTGVGLSTAQAIARAFPEAPPDGPTAVWLHRIEPESARAVLADVLQSFQCSNLTEDKVADSISRLRSDAELRELKQLKVGAETAEDRQEIFERLRRAKPDARVRDLDETEPDLLP